MQRQKRSNVSIGQDIIIEMEQLLGFGGPTPLLSFFSQSRVHLLRRGGRALREPVRPQQVVPALLPPLASAVLVLLFPLLALLPQAFLAPARARDHGTALRQPD